MIRTPYSFPDARLNCWQGGFISKELLTYTSVSLFLPSIIFGEWCDAYNFLPTIQHTYGISITESIQLTPWCSLLYRSNIKGAPVDDDMHTMSPVPTISYNSKTIRYITLMWNLTKSSTCEKQRFSISKGSTSPHHTLENTLAMLQKTNGHAQQNRGPGLREAIV